MMYTADSSESIHYTPRELDDRRKMQLAAIWEAPSNYLYWQLPP